MDLSASGLDEADLAVAAGNLSAATGGAAPHHAWRLLCELAAASGGGPEDGAEAAADGTDAAADGGSPVLAALEAAMALAPCDPLEGMLVAQMTAVHAAAMRCLIRATECGADPKIEALYLREAARLLHLFQRQAEMLDRRACRMGRAGQAGTDAGGAGHAGDAGGAATADDTEGQELLARAVEAVRTDLRALRRARQDADAQGASQAAGREPGPGGGPGP